MNKNIEELARKLGATIVGQVPETGGGAFGAAKLAYDVARLRAEMRSIRITSATFEQLTRIAERESTQEKKVEPLELASKLLQEAVASLSDSKM